MVKSYVKRFVIVLLSLAFFAMGNVFCVLAGSAGTNAWNTLALGMSGTWNLSFGTATLLISITIVVIDIIFKGKIGFGTLMNATLVAFFSDLFINWFSFIPAAQSQFLGVIYALIGQLILSFGAVFYMSPGLGAGPRDTLMIILGNRFPKAPIGTVKFGMEIGVMLAGVLLGAPFGFGTVLSIATQSSLFQLACKVCRYEPRDAVHEDMVETVRKIAGRKL